MSLDKLNDNARRSAQARFSDASVLHAARKPHPEGVSPHFCRREIRRREGLLATDAWGSFVCSAGDGKCKRAAEATVPINGLQAGAALMSGASSVELAPRELRLACLCT